MQPAEEQLTPDQVTGYLRALGEGDTAAVDQLLPHVYADLREVAERVFRDQWRNHTLQPTALAHEAYLRMVRPEGAHFENRRHFLSVAALAMRQLLMDYARGHGAQKRGGARNRLLLEDIDEPADESGVDLVEVYEALEALRELDERQARIVELRFLTGLTIEETAEVLDVSVRTVSLDWSMARSWLERRLGAN